MTKTKPDRTRPADPARRRPPARWADPSVLVVQAAVVGVAVVVGAVLNHRRVPIHADAAPLFATWLPHVGPGTPLAVAIAALGVYRGPDWAARLPWRRLMIGGYLTALAWTLSLALIDGWSRGLATRLTPQAEYLHDVPKVTGIPALISQFASHILDFRPGSWATHVAGHPPGAFLIFVLLNRLGLGGGGPAALACVLIGACAPLAVGRWWPAVAGGLLLGFSLYLSYGLVLVGPLALAVILLKPHHRWVTGAVGVAGVGVVVAAFSTAGFWWLTGYHLVVQRYYQGWAADRPYGYWVWANLACLVVSAGPAAVPALRRAAAAAIDRWRHQAHRPPDDLPGTGAHTSPAFWLPALALLAITAADLSGLSKAEVERIWLPYEIWLLPAIAWLPAAHHRCWLAVQALTALTINHLLLTDW